MVKGLVVNKKFADYQFKKKIFGWQSFLTVQMVLHVYQAEELS